MSGETNFSHLFVQAQVPLKSVPSLIWLMSWDIKASLVHLVKSPFFYELNFARIAVSTENMSGNTHNNVVHNFPMH